MYNPARIPTTAQLRALESAWINNCHPSWGMTLMEVAGINAARLIMDVWFDIGGQIDVICGRGNNGGDGLVVARHLHRLGLPVNVHMVQGVRSSDVVRKHDLQPAPQAQDTRRSTLESEHAINKAIFDSLGLRIMPIAPDQLDALEHALQSSSLIVDALLGTGLDRDVEGVYAEAIALINQSGTTVIALDLPSGINSDTGQIMADAVQADYTVTFGYLKAGLLHYPGATHAGQVCLVDIGLPDATRLAQPLSQLSEMLAKPSWWLATSNQVREFLPERDEPSHKGTYGRLLSIAGSVGMTGSALLAARAALRTGVGLSILAVGESVARQLPAEEIIYRLLPETTAGTISAKALDHLIEEMNKSSALLIGPGLGDNSETDSLVEGILSQLTIPCIVDADALNTIARHPKIAIANGHQVIFTPHPKELSRLLGIPAAEIQADRMKASQAAVDRFGVNVILKGAHTVVATVNNGSYIIPTGNPGMATAGCGDVLSGMVGAFLAMGLEAGRAAVCAAYLHGVSGDFAALLIGTDGIIAGDLIEQIPQSIAKIRSGEFAGEPIEQEVLPF